MRTARLHLLLFVFAATCATTHPQSLARTLPPQAAQLAHGSKTRNVVIVTIDGVRWQEIFGGVDRARAEAEGFSTTELLDAPALPPNLHRYFFDEGVAIGAPGHGEMVASGPAYLSLPGYREIFTGRSTACTSNYCDPIHETTMLDELRAQGIPSEQIAVITSWGTIERAASRNPSAITVSAGRHGGATRDRIRVSAEASDLLDRAAHSGAYPGWFDYRPDAWTGALALDYLAGERPRLLFIGLGDTDEHAHRGDYRGYLESLRSADQFIGRLIATLAGLGEYGASTTILVTTDHGRAKGFTGHGAGSPESARVWLLAAGGSVPARGMVDLDRKMRLADVAPTVRSWLQLPDDVQASAGRPIAALGAGPATVLASRQP